jgi:hypothetical protein
LFSVRSLGEKDNQGANNNFGLQARAKPEIEQRPNSNARDRLNRRDVGRDHAGKRVRFTKRIGGADVKAVKGKFAESAGVEAIAHGFFLMNIPDLKSLEIQMPLYDALYRYCQDVVQKSGA